MQKKTGLQLLKLMPVLLIGCLALVACGGTEVPRSDPGSDNIDQPGAQRERKITLAEGTEITTLNPYRSISTPDRHLIGLLFQGLVKLDREGKFVGDLAEDWSVSEDGLVWTFKLKEGVKFANGEPFNAEAAVFAFDVITDEEYGHIFYDQFAAITEARAVDEYVLELHTAEPFAPLLTNLAHHSAAMVAPQHFQDTGEDFGMNPVGTGPYKFKSWEGTTVVLERNPYWRGEQPWADTVTQVAIPEEQARVAALERGEVDIAVKLPVQDLQRLEDHPDVEVQTFPSLYTISFEVNVLKEPFSNPLVRHALMYAIDREAIVEGILNGYAEPANSPVGPGNPHRRTFPVWEYDPGRARELLTEAGYQDGFSMAVWTPHGRYLKDVEVAEAVTSYWQDIGIDAEIQVWEWTPYVEAALEPPSAEKEMDVALLGRGILGADFWMYRLWHSQSTGNTTGYANAEVDELLERGRVTFDLDERDEIYGRAQEIIFQEVPFIFLHHQKQTIGVRKGLKGLWGNPSEDLDLFGVHYED